MRVAIVLSLLLPTACAFTHSSPFFAVAGARTSISAAASSHHRTNNVALTAVSRKDFLLGTTSTVAASLLLSVPAFAASETTTLPSGLVYTINKQGSGPKPDIGELVAIRFKATAGENIIDDIFETPEPYYTRVGSGGMLKGVEETLPLMRVGDRWTLTIPVSILYGYSSLWFLS